MRQQILLKRMYLPKYVMSLPRKTVTLKLTEIRAAVLLKQNFKYIDNILDNPLHQILELWDELC
jgi:hypothetical protein